MIKKENEYNNVRNNLVMIVITLSRHSKSIYKFGLFVCALICINKHRFSCNLCMWLMFTIAWLGLKIKSIALAVHLQVHSKELCNQCGKIVWRLTLHYFKYIVLTRIIEVLKGHTHTQSYTIGLLINFW